MFSCRHSTKPDRFADALLESQAKLLRVLQEGEFERIGEDRTRLTDVRIVAATNRDLRAEVATGRFRQDLFYRLSVFPVGLPPLRERKEDIPLLAEHFLRLSARRLGRQLPPLQESHIRQLMDYDWRGNVRELQHVIERAVIVSIAGELRFDVGETPGVEVAGAGARDEQGGISNGEQILTYDQMRELETANVLRALNRVGWRISGAEGAAKLLGIKPSTLTAKLKVLGIRRTSTE